MREVASNLDIMKLRGTIDYLFGRGVGDALLKGDLVEVVRSRRTGRIREVYVDGVLVAVIRTSDGFLLPTIEGAKKMIKSGKCSKVVVIPNDVAEFIAKGRTLFAKHVLKADPGIRAGDEVIVVNEDGNVVAVGRAKLTGVEMVRAKRGVAVKIRKGILE